MNSPEDVSYSAETADHWWRQASVCPIYPRSFSDSEGNGLGDVRGITAKVPLYEGAGDRHRLGEPLLPVRTGGRRLRHRGPGLPEGSSPLWDRDEVPSVYAQWRSVFNEYTPPRAAGAESRVHAERRSRYSRPDGLGRVFNFDLLLAAFDAEEFRASIDKNLAEAASSGMSSDWVLSDHIHGLPQNAGRHCHEWLLAGGLASGIDTGLGLSRARAVSLLMFALPGSAYLYQGEELGLQEVGAHLPQSSWLARYAVDAQDKAVGSTLELYRAALRYRRHLRTEERLTWVSAGGSVLHFGRPNGWQSVTNFGTGPVDLPAGIILLSSGPLAGGKLPANTTAWII